MNRRTALSSAELHIYECAGRPPAFAEPEAEAFLGAWCEEGSCFLFFSAPADRAVADFLARHPGLALRDTHRMAYADWQGSLPEEVRVGRFRFLCRGRAQGAAAPPSPPALVLDPGLVFGNGLHPTTRDCLRALEHAVRDRPPGRVLDLGTGTGILALAAASLGGRVLAVDVNPLAARTARRNVLANGLAERVLVVSGRAEDFAGTAADLALANLHGSVLLGLLAAGAFRRTPRWVLSGLLRGEVGEARRRLRLAGYEVRREWAHEGVWHTLFACDRRLSGGAGSCRS
ncbi:MAG: 50S ribosomal protein L11 methyltransferase [Desulfobacterales bacterium]